MIVAYLPQPHEHPLWNEIQGFLQAGTDPGVNVLDENELVWIAFEGSALFAAGTIALIDKDAWLLAVGGFEHQRWLQQALEVAANWARDCNAHRLLMRGRKGWARAFRALGWDCSRDGEKWLYSKEI